jgi:hypothetical protein
LAFRGAVLKHDATVSVCPAFEESKRDASPKVINAKRQTLNVERQTLSVERQPTSAKLSGVLMSPINHRRRRRV